MKLIITSLIALALVGCSTSPVSPSAAKSVLPASQFKQSKGKVALTLVRDSGMISGGCAITTLINGEKVSELETGEKTVAYVSPGNIIVGAGFMGKGLCKGVAPRERDFNIEADTPKVLRVFIDQSGNVDILPTSMR